MKKCAVLLCLMVVLSGCKTTSMGVGTEVAAVDAPMIERVNDEDVLNAVGKPEIAVSPEALLRQRSSLGVARNEAMEEYLNGILVKIQTAWPGDNVPCSVFLVPSAEFGSFYAEGSIFVAYGLLRELECEDELAALVAHEYSHALLGHDAIGGFEKLADHMHGIAHLYMQVRYTQEGAYGGIVEDYLLNMVVNEASQKALLPVFSREQEDDADSLGTDLMIRAGYNPLGMVYLLQRVDDWENRTRKISSDRAKKLEELIERQSATNPDGGDKVDSLSFEPLFRKIEDDLATAYAEMKRQHYPASEREVRVKGYIREYYADVPRDNLKEQEFRQALEQQEAASFMRSLDKLDACDRALKGKDVDAARKAVMSAYKTLHEDVAYVRHVSIEVDEMGRKLSVDDLHAVCDMPDSLLFDHEKLVAYYERRDPVRALDIAEKAFNGFGRPSRMLPTLVRLNKKLDNDLAATGFYLVCLADGNAGLINMCRQAYD